MIISIVAGIISIIHLIYIFFNSLLTRYKHRMVPKGVYHCAWVDPIKEEINISISKLSSSRKGLTVKVLYLHKSRHNFLITLQQYKKNEDIFSGWWTTKRGNPVYKGPVLFRYTTDNRFEGKWLGPKQNHEINGGIFIINYIATSKNKYITYKCHKPLYLISNLRLPRIPSIIKDITAKHESSITTQFKYENIILDIPKNSFNPAFGKISISLLEYVRLYTPVKSDVLDLGTGCGFYAIVLAKFLKCNVKGVDISSRDINIATSNASNNSVTDLTEFQTVCHKDPFYTINSDEKYDVIIANLPFSRLSNIVLSIRNPMATCFYGSRLLLEKLILGSSYHIKRNGKLIFAYADSGYKNFIEDLIAVSPWTTYSLKQVLTSKDDTFYIYDLRLRDEFKKLVDTKPSYNEIKTAHSLSS